MATDHAFQFECADLPAEAVLVGFRGTEALSEPYRFEVFLTLPGAELPSLADPIGVKAKIAAKDADPAYEIHGVVAAATILHETRERALLCLELAPRLAELGLGYHSRMFTDMSISDIVRDVLDRAGFTSDDYELRLNGTYLTHEHVCQYKESDLAFISRWLEHEGIYYFFEQTDSLERVVFVDTPGAHHALRSKPVRYHPREDHDLSSGQSFRVFRCAVTSRPKSVTLTDYDYARPSLAVQGSAAVVGTASEEIQVHGARFFDPQEGARLAQVRAEEWLAGRSTCHGIGRVLHLRPGFQFDLEDHPLGAANRTYLCTRLRHTANLSATTSELRALTGLHIEDVYQAEVDAMANDVAYRAPRHTPLPRIPGLERATVDGPADSDYAQLDDQGRYLVKLGFDESALEKGKASTRVRMLQPHAGAPEGCHWPLRKGTEVLLGFLGGDPDRPVVVGAVPNAVTPSPVTEANKTQNVIETGGSCRFELEDEAKKQHVFFYAPPQDTYLHLGVPFTPTQYALPLNPSHYIVLHTKGNCGFLFGSNQDVLVGGKLTEDVGGAVDEKYCTSQKTSVVGSHSVEVTGLVDETYKTTLNTTVNVITKETYEAGQATTVGGLRKEDYLAGQNTSVTGTKREHYKSGQVKMVDGAVTELHAGTLTSTVNGSVLQSLGDLNQDYGATVLINKSVNWSVSGGVQIKTSSWQLNAPTDVWSLIKKSFSWAKKNEITGYGSADTGTSISVTGAGASACAVKGEDTVVAITAGGVETGEPAFAKNFAILHVICRLHIHAG